MTNILFLHAHPDDEAIFTGGTIAALADAGHEITVVFGTGGELGEARGEHDIALTRREEALRACSILGVKNVHFLGYHDSGLDKNQLPSNSLYEANLQNASEELLSILRERGIHTIFCDDEYGVYGHPDHVKCHDIAKLAAQIYGLDCIMESTVDGEHLHFVESHLVGDAFLAYGIEPESALFRHSSTRQHPGLTTVEITTTVKVNGAHLKAKRDAMSAHTSQIPPSSSALLFEGEKFEEVYGLEWFRHVPIRDGHQPGTSLFDDIR